MYINHPALKFSCRKPYVTNIADVIDYILACCKFGVRTP